MGYYITVLPALRIKEEYIDAVRRLVELERQKGEEQNQFLGEMELSESGDVEYDEPRRKWQETGESFARKLASFVKEGILEFQGEEGERWGYEFDGKGNVYCLEYVTRRGEKLLPKGDGN
ncbi:MAG: hypothetical protein HY788_17610 [Deltaproteobacteria bacterium]|nr:hypothetical protein [Deltaproteobacteria bacterium]